MIRTFAMAVFCGVLWLNALSKSDAVLWNAGEDMVAAERDALLNNIPTETNFQNQMVPEWSYGTRTFAEGWESSAFTGFAAADHKNDFANVFFTANTFDGFISDTNGGMAVNYTANDSAHFQDFVKSHEIFLHPGAGNSPFYVIRFTAPQTASYSLSTYWRHLNANTGNGGFGHVVLNGNELNTQTWGQAAGATNAYTNNNLLLNAGDLLDFVIDAGPANDYTSDSTAFNATISVNAVPEPSSMLLFAAAGSGFGVYRRFKKKTFNAA